MSRMGGQQSVEWLPLDCAIDQPLPDRRLPVTLISKAQKAAESQRVQARRAMDAAYEAELVMGLADGTPDSLDPSADHPGARKSSWAPDTELPGVSEFFTAELAVVLPAAAAPPHTLPSGRGSTARTCRPRTRRWSRAGWTSRRHRWRGALGRPVVLPG